MFHPGWYYVAYGAAALIGLLGVHRIVRGATSRRSDHQARRAPRAAAVGIGVLVGVALLVATLTVIGRTS